MKRADDLDLRRIDHLVWATRDLEEAIEEMADRTGVRASAGGAHVGLGTRNALLSLGTTSYLEIIGPDPLQPEPQAARPFGIDSLQGSGLVTWAIASGDIERSVVESRTRGWDPGDAFAMSRRTPQGELLEWRLTRARDAFPARRVVPVPFLIDWGSTPHPAGRCAQGCRLLAFEIDDPQPERVDPALAALGLDLRCREAESRLVARIATPRGDLVLT